MTTSELESQVRSYSRSWPTVFDRATGSTLSPFSSPKSRSYIGRVAALPVSSRHGAPTRHG